VPKIEFGTEFKKKSYFDYPKLSLEQNEKARVCVMDSPTMEYVHTLRKVITENGRPIMETQRFGKNQERTREVPQTDFVGKFICLGDPDVLADKSVDPNNCPACKASVENGAAVDGPRRRFVVHVIKYQTNKGSFNLQTPFQVELLAWEFTEQRFNALVDIVEEHGSLPRIDLCLGPCQNKGFQKYDIIPGGNCQWAADDDRKGKTKAVLTANRSEDLSPLLGRKVNDTELRSQVADVLQAYAYAFGRNDAMPGVDTNAANDLSGLLDDAPAAIKPNPETRTELDDLRGASGAPDTPAASTATQGKDEIEDLESLLSDL
jgi:hypothetical protein